MLLQSLIVIAALLVISGSILLETLVTAKVGAHQALLAKSQTALTDATASFVQWAQNRVATYGTNDASGWPGLAGPQYDATVCPPPVPPPGPAPSPCPFAAFATWQVRGTTVPGQSTSPSPAPGVPDAQNLAPTVNEQRLAAAITVRLTAADSVTTLATVTRDVTARIFEAPPYVVITGTRDSVAAIGSIHAGEGDTAGAVQYGALGPDGVATPDPSAPAAFTDTRILTSIDCRNRPGFDRTAPAQPALSGEIDRSFHPYGNADWAYETACDPSAGVPSAPPGLSGYIAPVGTLYATSPGDHRNEAWNPNVENASSFPR